MSVVTIRIDDIGASTKHFNQYGKRWFRIGGVRVFLPFTNIGPLKRMGLTKGWGVYDELTAQEWKSFFAFFKQQKIVPIVAITAAWVEKDGTLTPFPEKFPEEAVVLRRAAHEGVVVIANHGLTHCVVGKHLPRFWGSNRKYHREFYPELPQELHREHVVRSQNILETFFGRPITIFVPPGNVWSKKTYHALIGTNIRQVMCNRYMQDSSEKMRDIVFIDDREQQIVLHDRDLKLRGLSWFSDFIKRV